MVVSPQRLTRWPSYVRDRHAAITYTTPRDAPHQSLVRLFPPSIDKPERAVKCPDAGAHFFVHANTLRRHPHLAVL
ncbi:hypothetical protein CKJ62_24550 [Mycobacterium avium]|nr:hypothetical protein CKJ62_24550 [Mycobacterium avium]